MKSRTMSHPHIRKSSTSEGKLLGRHKFLHTNPFINDSLIKCNPKAITNTTSHKNLYMEEYIGKKRIIFWKRGFIRKPSVLIR